MNKFLKLIGYQHNYGGRDRSYKFSWGEIALWTKNLGIHWSGGEYCYEPKLVIQAYFINAYIPTWSFGVKPGEFGVPETRFGFYLYSSLHNWNSTVFFFGKWSKHVICLGHMNGNEPNCSIGICKRYVKKWLVKEIGINGIKKQKPG